MRQQAMALTGDDLQAGPIPILLMEYRIAECGLPVGAEPVLLARCPVVLRRQNVHRRRHNARYDNMNLSVSLSGHHAMVAP